MAVGGDILEITFNHPTLGSWIVFGKSAEDSTYDLGGVRTTDDSNMVAGNGEIIKQMNRGRWSFETTVAWDMNTREDMEKLNDLAADPVDADITISHINNTIYGGTGTCVGDLQGNGNSATFTMKLSGGGKLKKIA